MNLKKDIAILIPSLNPDMRLIKYVEELIEIGFKKIIIVNDGSDNKYDKYFNELENIDECIILRHKENYGKGKALKTGFSYYLQNLDNFKGIITADSDGQHLSTDTLKIANTLIENQDSLILGTRNFNKKEVPFKSKYGNKITSVVFERKHKIKINDTQTGLRGIPNNFIKNIIAIDGTHFEYEMNVLIEAINKKIDIIEVPIKTVYIEKNKNSHFNPIKDAFKIYSILLSKK